MSERGDSIETVASELRNCAHGWERDVRLVGNVRAEDIARVCDALDAARAELAKVTAERDALVERVTTADEFGEREALVDGFRAMRARAEKAEAELARLRGPYMSTPDFEQRISDLEGVANDAIGRAAAMREERDAERLISTEWERRAEKAEAESALSETLKRAALEQAELEAERATLAEQRLAAAERVVESAERLARRIKAAWWCYRDGKESAAETIGEMERCAISIIIACTEHNDRTAKGGE